MKKLIELYKKHREMISYLFWGGMAFLLSMVLFWLFASKFGWGEVTSNNIDWIICVIFTFFTNKFFVFRSKSANAKGFFKEFVEFVAARLFTLLLEDGIIWLLCSKMGWQTEILELAAKLIGQFVVIVTNYILSKLWIFKKPKKSKKVEDQE